ncbi:MAG: 2-oxo acid dehydrogenase subunit E2 [Acidimicrobiaceae bacterium]|nr:2-oxo acid dehydrogenase subunit E2 [Acidimicrobiaceae bacterium]
MADVFMPQLGETVADGTVTKWFKQVGDTVTRGEPLFEVSTDKVDTEIPAQADGVLSQILVNEGTTVDVGTKLAVIGGVDDELVVTSAGATPGAGATAVATASAPALAASSAGEKLSPVVRRLLAENGLEASDVTGTGPGGRITKDDVAVAAAARTSPTNAAVAQLSPVVRRLLSEVGLEASDVEGSGPDGRITRRDVELAAQGASGGAPREDDEVIAFSKIRKLTAEHMVRSKATSAHTLMVKEVDFESIERVRRSQGATFKATEGFSLTYLPFIAVATLAALREYPHLNSSVGNDELIVHHTLNLGIAVDLDSEGLVVPVVKHADALNVSQMARSIRDLATRARTKALGVDDMSGGTFTITNPGPYGTLITGAVINQPQVAILSTDGVTRKPVVVTAADGSEAIAIHSVGLVALTFDHRAIDGAYAARFLARLAQLLQEGDWATRL